jgi:hypothetical protein
VSYPWGRFDHTEQLTYDVDDAHPELASVRGDSEYIQAVKDHVLTWRGRLDVSSDARTFFYKYTRTLLRDGTVIRTKTWEEPIPPETINEFPAGGKRTRRLPWCAACRVAPSLHFNKLFQLIDRPLAGVHLALDLLVPGTFCRQKTA